MIPHVSGQPSPCATDTESELWSPWAATTEPHAELLKHSTAQQQRPHPIKKASADLHWWQADLHWGPKWWYLKDHWDPVLDSLLTRVLSIGYFPPLCHQHDIISRAFILASYGFVRDSLITNKRNHFPGLPRHCQQVQCYHYSGPQKDGNELTYMTILMWKIVRCFQSILNLKVFNQPRT